MAVPPAVPKGLGAYVRQVGSAFTTNWTPLLYAGSSAATAVAQLVTGFLVLKWVAPEDMGLWQGVRLAQVYSFVLLAGVNNGLSRELPFSLGKGDQVLAERLAATALVFTNLVSVPVVLAGITCVVLFAARGMQMVYGILAVTALIPISFYQTFLLVTFRSKDSFNKLALIQLAQGGLSILTLPMVYVYHYEGMLLRTVLIAGGATWLMYVYRPIRVRMRMELGVLKLLLRTGLPIFGLDYMKNSASTVDRLCVLEVGGVTDLGFYSLASTALQTLQGLPQSLAAYVYPRMSFAFGQHGDARKLWGVGCKFVALAVGLTGFAALVGWLLLPHLLAVIAPKYMGGLRAAQILLIAGVLDGAAIGANALWSMKAWRLMVAYQLLGAAVLALGPLFGALVIGASLEGVAWGLVIGYLCRTLLALGLTFYGTRTMTPQPSQ